MCLLLPQKRQQLLLLFGNWELDIRVFHFLSLLSLINLLMSDPK